jgi:PAS domain S-box-containing protein
MKDCILYIDDEKENLESFRIALWMNYDISTASNTKEARKILNEKEIKLVITDQRMPEETGLDFVSGVYNDFPDVIYMVLTGYTDVSVVIDAINYGNIYRFMTKPWDLQEMKQSIENGLETYHLRKKNTGLLEELRLKNEELRKSEYKFRNIFNSSLDSICIINNKGEVLEVNAITCTTSGYSRKELKKKIFVDVFPKNQHEKINKWLKKLFRKGEVFFESSYSNYLGDTISLDIIAKEIDYLGDKAYLIVARDISEKKELQQKIIKTTINSEERERTRIAQELHDGIGPLLSSIKLYTETYFNSEDVNFKNNLENQILDSIDDTIDHVSAISNNLSPHILKNFGLKTAIQKFCDKIQKSTEITIFRKVDIGDRLTEEIEVTFYRVVIELVNNTIKHANASEIGIELSKNGNTIALYYFDNGIGYKLDELLKKSKGMGLFNIKSRIESLNGELSFNSVPQKKTQLMINVPL